MPLSLKSSFSWPTRMLPKSVLVSSLTILAHLRPPWKSCRKRPNGPALNSPAYLIGELVSPLQKTSRVG